jgi:serine/threonine protein phosphatase PrpC
VSLEVFGATDIGRKRESNEDDFFCLEFSPGEPVGPRPVSLLLVADGVGGHQAGGRASSLAAESVRDFFARRAQAFPPDPDWSGLLAEAYREANARIHELSRREPELNGMGSTLVAALVNGGTAYLANVGDSRAYRLRRKSIVQVSRDHSWVEEQRRLNALSEEEINLSPFKHMITRSLGYEPRVEVDTFEVGLEDGDYLLLCSDGLYGVVSDGEMLKVFRRQKTPEKICRRLIEEANRAGSRDNITAVVACYRRRRGGELDLPSRTVKLSAGSRGWKF